MYCILKTQLRSVTGARTIVTILCKSLSSCFAHFRLSLTMANALKCHGLFVRYCQGQAHNCAINKNVINGLEVHAYVME